MGNARASLVCDRVRAQVALSLDGELSQLERAMLASHLDRCDSCRAYGAEVTAITRVIRKTPMERMEGRVTVQPRRRGHAGRIQLAAAAAAVVLVTLAASQVMKPDSLEPSFVPTTRSHIKLPAVPQPQQIEKEQVMLERARPGQPVQLQGAVL